MRETHEQRARVLVVEDEPDVRRLVETIWEEAGFAVTGVAREGEAVRRLREEPYAVVVTDLYVTRGQEEGVESIGALLREAGGTPVVVTGWPIEEEAAKAAGARSVVSKSFELGEVVRAVKEALAGREG